MWFLNLWSTAISTTLRFFRTVAENSYGRWIQLKRKTNRRRKGVPPLFEPEPQSRWLHTCSDCVRSEYRR